MKTRVIFDFKTNTDDAQDSETLIDNFIDYFIRREGYLVKDLIGLDDVDGTECINITFEHEKVK